MDHDVDKFFCFICLSGPLLIFNKDGNQFLQWVSDECIGPFFVCVGVRGITMEKGGVPVVVWNCRFGKNWSITSKKGEKHSTIVGLFTDFRCGHANYSGSINI